MSLEPHVNLTGVSQSSRTGKPGSDSIPDSDRKPTAQPLLSLSVVGAAVTV